MPVSLETRRQVINMVANYMASTKGQNYFPTTTPDATIEQTYAEWQGYWTRKATPGRATKYIHELAVEVRSFLRNYRRSDLETGSQPYLPPQHNAVSPTVGDFQWPRRV